MGIRSHRERRRQRGAEPAREGGGVCGVSLRCLENLWVRLKVGDRLRPRDAETLRRLALSPFDRSTVYELDSRGYVIAVGLPGETHLLDAGALLAVFEARFGVPASFVPLGLRAAS
ncbi:MAG: hypothetical protein ACFCUT_16405 [Kiloniellaceae bacterium]